MKTITEYQPLIFAALADHQQKRRCRREQTHRAARIAVPLFYILAALAISADTGLVIWNWQFWVIYVPLFLLGERVLMALSATIGHDTGRS